MITTRRERRSKRARLGLVQHRDDRGGRARNEGHALALDQLERRAGAPPVQEHRARAGHDGLKQREVSPVQPEREIDEENVRLRHRHRLVQDRAGRERGIEAMGNALRVSRGTRGEGHAHHVVGAHGPGHERGRRAGALDHRVKRGGAGRAGPAEDADGLEILEPRPELLDHLHVVEALEAGGADERPALGEAQDVLHLAAAEVRPDLVCHCTDPLAGEEDIRELHPVGDLDGHHVPRANAELLQSGGGAVHPLLQLTVRHAVAMVDDGLAVGMRPGPTRQELIEGLAPPVAGAGVALDQLRRQARLETHAIVLLSRPDSR